MEMEMEMEMGMEMGMEMEMEMEMVLGNVDFMNGGDDGADERDGDGDGVRTWDISSYIILFHNLSLR